MPDETKMTGDMKLIVVLASLLAFTICFCWVVSYTQQNEKQEYLDNCYYVALEERLECFLSIMEDS